MGFGGSVVWFVDICVSSGVGSAYGIIFGIDNGSDMGYSDGFFDGSNDGKYESSLLDEWFEQYDGTLLDLSDIVRSNNSGVRRSIGRCDVTSIVSGVVIDVGGEVESGDGG